MAERSPRGYLVTVVGGLALGGLVLLAASRPWASADVSSPRSAVRALGLVVIAGFVAVLATRGTGRRVVGGLLALAGLALTAAAWWADGVDERTGWVLVTVGLGLAIAVLGLVVARYGPDWPAMGSRFDRGDSDGSVSPDGDPADVWRALDRGDDPTA